MNIYDIAKEAGVSIATISRVINGSDKVRESTRKRILELIEKYSDKNVIVFKSRKEADAYIGE